MISLDYPGPMPPGPLGPYLNGIFPSTAPGEVGSWEVEDAFPGMDIPSPVRILPFPGSNDLMVLSKL